MKNLSTVLVLFVLAFSLSVNAQSKVGIQGTLALPMGDFGDGYDLGFGGTVTYMYMVNPNLAVTGSAGYLTWSGKDALDGATFSSIPVLVGVRYMFGGGGKFMPYGFAQLGMHFISSEVDVPSYTVGGITVGGGTISSSDSFFGFGAGLGFLYQLSDKMNLDVNAGFDNISTTNSSSSYIGINAGVAIAL